MISSHVAIRTNRSLAYVRVCGYGHVHFAEVLGYFSGNLPSDAVFLVLHCAFWLSSFSFRPGCFLFVLHVLFL